MVPVDAMKRLCLLLAGAVAFAAPAHALDQRLERSLRKLDPASRLEQSCDAAVMEKIARETSSFAPDRVVAYAIETPTMQGDAITSPGAAFRSHGEWYRLSFRCEAAPDHIEIRRLNYRIGERISHEQWERYDLYG